jgi:eukaryotic-like serine/threonine-protein kinase
MSTKLHSPGDKLGGRYSIIEFVGEGGMQEVYKTTDELLSRVVALKAPKNNSAEKRFQRSAIVSAKVNHQNVAKTLDYFEEEDRAYLIEEFVDGLDFSRILKERISIFDPQFAARLFHLLAKGVAASHHAGVVHRDLKPSNIMAVGGRSISNLKITDFGIAKMAEEEIGEAVEGGESSLTASQTAIGALPYMAPEMVKSMKDAGMPADIWSLGALMFELLTGKKPFGTGLRAVPAILSGVVPALDTPAQSQMQFKFLSDDVESLIRSCLQLDPNKRPTADQLVSACEGLCYPANAREFGRVSSTPNNWWGFIAPEQGKSVFFHRDSVFGHYRLKVGDRVWFGRHPGGRNDRAFPVIRVPSTKG